MSKNKRKQVKNALVATNSSDLTNKRASLQGGITAKNAIDTALRLSDWDLWYSNNQSLNLVNGYNNIQIEPISLQQILLTYLYKTYGILEKIVTVPVDEAYKRGGFDLEAETLEDEEIDELKKALEKHDDIERLKTAQYWARLFGGGALVLIGDTDDLKKPINYDKLYGQDIKFMPVDKFQLTYSKANINMPDGVWNLTQYGNVEANVLTQIHPDRVRIIKGKKAPFIVAQQLQGWGMSCYENIFQDMAQFFKSRNVLFEILDEAKTDILKLATLETALSSANGEIALQKMVDMIARNKNYKSQITLSTKDEYEQKQLSFSGIADILKEIRIMMAGSANIPVNKIWGEGVTGFGSGEDSLENFNSLVENEIRTPANNILEWMLRIRCYQLFGREVKDLVKVWKPLRVMSAIDEQNVNNHKVNNALQLYDRGLLSPQEIMEYLKKQGIFLHNTKAINGELEDMPLGGFTELRDVTD